MVEFYDVGRYLKRLKYKYGVANPIDPKIFKKLYSVFLLHHDSYEDFKNHLEKQGMRMKDSPRRKHFYMCLLEDYKNDIQVDDSMRTKTHTKYTIKQALICENCFNVIHTDVNIDIKEPIDWYKQSDLYLGVGILCPCCEKKFFHFTVDRNIATLVSLLNQMKYYTDYSCQGHPDIRYDTSKPEEGRTRLHPTYAFHYAHPYIVINGKKKLSKKFYELLRNNEWNIEIDNPDMEDGVPWIVNDPDKCIGAKKFTIRLSGAYIDSFLCQLTNDIKAEKHIKAINKALDDFFVKSIKELKIDIKNKILIPNAVKVAKRKNFH